ncbi:hypothetical protein GCM10010420_48780 [Streptomyces glaucosporus]|uniref:Lipoprotein CseA n=1 Tax=Streptomyces glaucosporus TaxID=284044 RepID=A0ABN3IUW6_9ACTN
MSVTSGARTAAATAAAVVLLASGLAGCDDGGVRIEDSAAPTAAVPSPSASPLSPPSPRTSPPSSPGVSPDLPWDRPAPRTPLPSQALPVYPPDTQGELDVLALLRADPMVGESVKKVLRPCSAEVWPVDVAYGRLTDGHVSDVLVNVSDCDGGMGVGSYVYRQSTNGQYVGVFAAEEPPVHVEAVRGRLRVVQRVYLDGDPVCCPSGRDVVTYVWRDGRFTPVEHEPPEPGGGGGSGTDEEG